MNIEDDDDEMGKQEMLGGGSNKANIKTQGFEMKSKM